MCHDAGTSWRASLPAVPAGDTEDPAACCCRRRRTNDVPPPLQLSQERPEMKGCTFKRVLPSGRISWGYVVDAGKDENGKRKQIFKSGFARKLDADIELAKLVNDRNEGSLVRPDPRTFAEFSDAWLAVYAEASFA